MRKLFSVVLLSVFLMLPALAQLAVFPTPARVVGQKGSFTVGMNAKGGVNYKIAEKMGLTDVRFMSAKEMNGVEYGSGVVGCFAEPLAADDFIILLKRVFGVECVQANELLRRPIRTVAMCGRSGAFLLDDAANAGIDAFVTGEMHYHEYFGREQQIQIAVIGHYQSEQFTSEIFREIIENSCEGVKCFIADTCTNPIMYF